MAGFPKDAIPALPEPVHNLNIRRVAGFFDHAGRMLSFKDGSHQFHSSLKPQGASYPTTLRQVLQVPATHGPSKSLATNSALHPTYEEVERIHPRSMSYRKSPSRPRAKPTRKKTKRHLPVSLLRVELPAPHFVGRSAQAGHWADAVAVGGSQPMRFASPANVSLATALHAVQRMQSKK